MTTNQTIDGLPRMLLDTIMFWLVRANERSGTDIPELKELRALLDAASAPCAKSQVEPAAQPQANCGACNGCTNGCRLDAESPPAQARGETVYQVEYVARYAGWRDVDKGTFNDLRKDPWYKARLMYAERPAPVARGRS